MMMMILVITFSAPVTSVIHRLTRVPLQCFARRLASQGWQAFQCAFSRCCIMIPADIAIVAISPAIWWLVLRTAAPPLTGRHDTHTHTLRTFPSRADWQGGVRVNAFLSGGALPASVRGTVSNELITVWDWSVRRHQHHPG
jgi:hypothetical protein